MTVRLLLVATAALLWRGACAGSCPSGEFQCDNGNCVPYRYVNEGDNDCGDWSDEEYHSCRSSQFTCANKDCVNAAYVCDGHDDCRDGSDEALCDVTAPPTTSEAPRSAAACGPDEFQCDNGNCVPYRYVDEGDNDCGDWSDEPHHDCRGDTFACENRNCVNAAYVCDGADDCGDGSDEALCDVTGSSDYGPGYFEPQHHPQGPLCGPSEFWCASGSGCASASAVCDGRQDCPDGSDELACNTDPCLEGQFYCTEHDGYCISGDHVCDALDHCDTSGSDELGCFTCAPRAFACGNGTCIHRMFTCNGVDDCGSGADEEGCDREPKLSYEKGLIIAAEGEEVELKLGVDGMFLFCEWAHAGASYNVEDVRYLLDDDVSTPARWRGNECGLVIDHASREMAGDWTFNVHRQEGESLSGQLTVVLPPGGMPNLPPLSRHEALPAHYSGLGEGSPPTLCPPPFQPLDELCVGVSSMVAPELYSWRDANGICQSVGGYLMTFDDAEQLIRVLRYVDQHTTDSDFPFWVGLSATSNETSAAYSQLQWKWADGRDMEPMTTFVRSPDARETQCGRLESSREAVIWPTPLCNVPTNFLCQTLPLAA